MGNLAPCHENLLDIPLKSCLYSQLLGYLHNFLCYKLRTTKTAKKPKLLARLYNPDITGIH